MSDLSQATLSCGCCEGVEPLTPEPTANRPGLDALRYRIGTHATFLETMIARLGTMTIPQDEYVAAPRPTPTPNKPPVGEDSGDKSEAEPLPTGEVIGAGSYIQPAAESAPAPPTPLRALTTRAPSDPAIALLDAWAIVGDVLTFYQERNANEGYLRTAVERRSVMDLARLVGYRARPGLSAGVYLSFTLEDTFTGETAIPAGTKAQSQPATNDEKAQVFETAELITARASWNRIKPRQTRAQGLSAGTTDFYVQGVGLNLRAGARLLVEGLGDPTLWRADEAIEDRAANRTHVILSPTSATPFAAQPEAMAAFPTPGGPVELAATLIALLAALNNIDDGELADIEKVQAQLVDALLLAMDALTQTDVDARREAIAAAGAALQELQRALEELLAQHDGSEALRNALALMQQLTAETLAILRGERPSPKPQGDPIQFLAKELAALRSEAAIPPATAYHLNLDTQATFNIASDLRLRLMATALGGTAPGSTKLLADLYKGARVYGLSDGNGQGDPTERVMALEAAAVTGSQVRVYVLKTAAAPFGHNAPLRTEVPAPGQTVKFAEWSMSDPLGTSTSSGLPHHKSTELYLDAEYDVAPGSWVYVERDGAQVVAYRPTAAQIKQGSLAAYGLVGKSTQLDFPGETPWIDGSATFGVVRSTSVYLGAEELTLAEAPILDPVPAEAAPKTIELNGVYEGLIPGRWVVVSGERADLADVTGVQASELVMIQNVSVKSDDGPPRSVLTFANKLENRYVRATVVLYANTVRATHGETVNEVLGSGDATRRWPSFELRKPPLSYLPAPTAAGAKSTLTVRVNDVRWHEADNHVLLGPTDRAYVLERREEPEFDATTVIFGDGQNGARLPTGVENVTAVYRSGLGRAGNVAARRIKQLASRPLGVKDVINALPATGGADREGRDQVRANAPLAVMALDRLVSVQDYADFARTFAGIGKAAAAELSDGRRAVVHLTIAGADDIPIDKTSDLYRNLRLALARAGDPWTPVRIELRELLLLVIIAGVRLHPDYLWSAVAPQIRARLYDLLSFARRDLGQDVTAGEIIAAIHGVPGVVYADLDVLDGLTGDDVIGEKLAEKLADLGQAGVKPNAKPQQRIKTKTARPNPDDRSVLLPAQLAYLDPRVPETLILKELKS